MIGEPVEHSLWYSGDSDDQKRKAEKLIRLRFEESVWAFGLIEFEVLSPGDNRVPEPPERFNQESPKLLLGFAEIIGTPQVDKKLSEDLEQEDLEKLRAATRRNVAANLTNSECDTLIDTYGPEAGARTIH